MTGKEIRKLRRSLDITQLQLSKMLGISQAMLSQIECGTRIGRQRKAVESKIQELAAQQEAA